MEFKIKPKDIGHGESAMQHQDKTLTIYDRYLQRLEQKRLAMAEQGELMQRILMQELAKRHQDEKFERDFSFRNTKRAL